MGLRRLLKVAHVLAVGLVVAVDVADWQHLLQRVLEERKVFLREVLDRLLWLALACLN